MQKLSHTLPTGRAAQRTGPKQRQIPVLVTMPQVLIDRLDKEAVRLGLDSRSQLVRLCCDNYLPENA